jgi:predicted nuclease of restriction endonuclease-like (RecB) superfamily
MGISRTVNTTQAVANWLIEREIVEEEQHGQRRAGYGEQLIEEMSELLQAEFGRGFAVRNLETFRQFYLEFPQLVETPHALRSLSVGGDQKWMATIGHTLCGESRRPGHLHPNLSWTHYRMLLLVEKLSARSFYEIEAVQNNWSARELERQIDSLLNERLALSRDKKGLARLARKGQEIQGPLDLFKVPLVLEFLKMPTSPKLVKSELEEALLNELQSFLLELGKGFAFVARQERITLEGRHQFLTPASPTSSSASSSTSRAPASGVTRIQSARRKPSKPN